MTEDQGVSGRVAAGEQALLASLPEPVPVSALPGNDPSRELGPQAGRLLNRLKDKGCVHFHASWGDEAGSLTGEEKAKAINDTMDWLSCPINSMSSRLRGEAMLQRDSAIAGHVYEAGVGMVALPETWEHRSHARTADFLIEVAEFLEGLKASGIAAAPAGETVGLDRRQEPGPQGDAQPLPGSRP